MAYKKTLTIGAVLVAAVAVLGLASASLAATGQNGSVNVNPHKKFNSAMWMDKAQQMKTKFAAEQSALDKADYQAWLNAVGPDSAAAKAITADKFSQLVEANKLAEQGRALMAQALKIRKDLGLPDQGKPRRPFGSKNTTTTPKAN